MITFRSVLLLCSACIGLMLTACAGTVTADRRPPTVASSQAVTPTVAPNPDASVRCQPSPIAVPTMPAKIPGYTELDAATDLHMTGTPQQIDPAAYRLQVTGMVEHPLSLTYDDLRCLPRASVKATLICPGFFVDIATWNGTPLVNVLRMAGVQPGATQLYLVSADGYTTWVFLDEAQAENNLVAYGWEDQPIPILHGFPVRMVFPAMEGNKWVKWLTKIEVN